MSYEGDLPPVIICAHLRSTQQLVLTQMSNGVSCAS
jgi:hypothetical protein